MKKFILSIFIFCFLVLTASEVFACSCSLPIYGESKKTQVKRAFKESTAVFLGEVTEVIKDPDVFYIKVKFKTEKAWKGKFTKEILVTTGQGGGDCGFLFEVGEKYLVYTYGAENSLGTSICRRTSLASETNDVAFLDKIKKPNKS